ncbi:MAG: hypothetical protein ABF913_04870 [Oenococcus sp.]|uniref:hypothetical protein n=1 Tax=Oenococcus sp. TaxID=1979414 RepID=UPI0039E85220
MALSINEVTQIILESYGLNQDTKVASLAAGYLVVINGQLFSRYSLAEKYLKEQPWKLKGK